jgi:thermitase
MQVQRRRILGVTVLVCAVAVLATASTGSATQPQSGGEARILVQFTPGASIAARNAALNSVHAGNPQALSHIGVVSITVPSNSRAAIAHLKNSNAVHFAEPDSPLDPQDILPSDPSFPIQYSIGSGAWGWYTTHTTQAWDITKGSPSIVIAILDTGLKTTGLSDFSGQVVPGWNILTGTSDTSSQAGNHGTYVAGVAGLGINNGIGGAGFCPNCQIMPVQVGTDSGALTSDIANGIIWAADHGARVINLSWAGTTDSQTLQDAINYAHGKGVVLVAAAGNSNCDCETYPSGDQNVISVAGTTSADTKASDSNFGSWVKVAAPEGNMTGWPTVNGAPGYGPVGGTSLAAPVVAGIAGLLFSYNPNLTNTQVETAIEQTASPISGFTIGLKPDGVSPGGRVDTLAALQSVGATDTQPSSLPVNTTPPQIYTEVNGDWNYTPLGTAAPVVGQVLLRGQGAWTGSATLSLSLVRWLRCDSSGANCVTAASTAKYTVLSTDAGSTFKLQIGVKNTLGQTILTTPATAVIPVPPSPPANTALPAITGTAQDGQTLSASTGTWSNSPTGYAYQWTRCDSGGANCVAISGATGSTYLETSADVGSTLDVQVTASNSAGSAVSPATAAPTAVVAAVLPANTALPAISGTLSSGQTLTATTGSWAGTTPITFTEQWQRCDSSGANCTAIVGATATTYLLANADGGSTIRVQVTATNGVGSVAATSLQTGVVTNLQTKNFSGTLSGTTKSFSFGVTIGAGESDATLTLSKSSSSAVTVQLLSGATVLASNSGTTTTPIALNTPGLAAGSYTYKVSWSASKGSLPFTLLVTAPAAALHHKLHLPRRDTAALRATGITTLLRALFGSSGFLQFG